MSELKRCPFCGGEAELREERIAGHTRFYVSCENDDCRVVVETRNSVSATRAGAEASWNRRVDDA